MSPTNPANWPLLSSRNIVAARSSKAPVDPHRPYAFLAEPERSAAGRLGLVATIFLTNRECPFRCVFCDLWRNTLDEDTPPGAVPAQIEWALQQLPATRHIKLYNSGNFSDPRAIPVIDDAQIAALMAPFETVIIENHPRFCRERLWAFRKQIAGELEVALGLETIHPEILPRLNKQMSVADYQAACQRLHEHDCAIRTFVLLGLPGLSRSEAILWAVRSIELALQAGARVVSLIATRTGNGAFDHLSQELRWEPPTLFDLYEAFCQALQLLPEYSPQVRIFADVWDLSRFCNCSLCAPLQIEVLQRMNQFQQQEAWPSCPHTTQP